MSVTSIMLYVLVDDIAAAEIGIFVYPSKNAFFISLCSYQGDYCRSCSLKVTL
jgi:hypothetical protein